MYERMRGRDAYYLHFEHERVRAHTLKCLVLDPSLRGRPLTLDDVRAAIGPRLALHPRVRQRAVRARGLPGSPVWVDDPEFSLDRHLGERTLPQGHRRALDELCSELATRPLPLDRPLWDLTLVHGLGSGRQAAVVRLHHCLSDGVAAANMLRRFTSPVPGGAPPVPDDDWSPSRVPTQAELRRLAVAELPAYFRRTATFAREFASRRDVRRRALRELRARDDLLGARPTARYSWTSPPLGGGRVCASHQLDLGAVRAVKDAHGVSLNTVLLAVVGAALRAEAIARGEQDPPSEVAGFGVAVGADDERITGNELTTVFVKLHTDVADPAERLRRIARSSTDSVEAVRSMVQGRTVRFNDLAARATPLTVRLADQRTDRVNANVITANVRGPEQRLWLGDVEVVDFVSWAIVVPPIGLNLTMYSYDDHVSVGALSTPEVTDDLHAFLRRLDVALDELAGHLTR